MDVEVGQEGACVEKKKRKRKIPIPPSPSFCLAAPCNTPNVKIEENRKKKKREKAAKKKVVRFSNVDKQTHRGDNGDDLPLSPSRRPWSAEVEVTPLEFSEHNYKTNAITAELFAGNIHMGYQEEEETRGEKSVEEEGTTFSSWRELFQSKMDN